MHQLFNFGPFFRLLNVIRRFCGVHSVLPIFVQTGFECSYRTLLHLSTFLYLKRRLHLQSAYLGGKLSVRMVLFFAFYLAPDEIFGFIGETFETVTSVARGDAVMRRSVKDLEGSFLPAGAGCRRLFG